jgi:hypothetical protein
MFTVKTEPSKGRFNQVGRDANFSCKTCKKTYVLGYGSYGTFINADTIEEYQALPNDNKDLNKNKNLEWCLTVHHGHDFIQWSGDWAWVDAKGRLMVEGGYDDDKVLIEDFWSYSKEPVPYEGG